MIQNYPTIVTMFYNIRKKEGKPQDDTNRKSQQYFELARSFILKLPYPLIINIDDDDDEVNQELIDIINTERKELSDKTHIEKIKFEETYYYKHINKLYELQQKYTIYNGDLNHETPEYIILNNNKHFFMENAIKKNLFNSSHFVWIDFGINHVARNTEEIHNWILHVPDKIKQMCINPYIENIENKIMFRNIYHHMAGGLFSGSAENMLKYGELFRKKTEQIYDEDWYQIDEAVMTMVQRENPELFDFFYGDYQGIVSNYLSPIHNISLIMTSLNKCVNCHTRREEAYHILCYCSKYFENNINDYYIYNYIIQNIVIDYYINNKMLTQNVINIINKKKELNDNGIIHLLEQNRENLSYYLNKDLIL